MTLPKVQSKQKDKNKSKSTQKSSEKSVVCYLCDVRFTQKKALYVHLRNKHNIEPLEKKEGKVQCPECKNTFYDKYNLKRHCRTAHGASPTLDEKNIILRGRILDTNRKPKFVQIIEAKYPSPEKHIQPDDNSCSNETQFKTNYSEEFICDTCRCSFTSKSNLIRHINDVHTEFQNLRCTECNEKFPDKRSLLQHTHLIEKYSSLKEILPDSYKYEVDQHVQINDTSFVSEIYCNLSCREDADQWLDKFQRKNKVTFRRMRRQCQSFDESYIFIIDRYRCQHNTLPKRQSTPHAKHTGCSATLFIRVYQHKSVSHLSWSKIRIKHTHNHLTEAAAKFRDPIEEVVNKFRTMFNAGKGPKAALNEHIRDLQLSYGDDVISDRGICPSSRWVYNFYQKLTKERFELSKKNEKNISSNIDTQITQDTYPVPTNLTSIQFSTYNEPYHDKPPDIQVQQFTLVNPENQNSPNLVSSLDKYQTFPFNICDDKINDHYSRSEYRSTTDIITLNNLSDQIHPRLNSCLNEVRNQKFSHHVDISKRILYDFDQVLQQICSRVSTNPVYFLNSMKNFIQTYNSTLQTQSSLNSALYSFGKFSEFQMNQL